VSFEEAEDDVGGDCMLKQSVVCVNPQKQEEEGLKGEM
jgi:hypothetical protein